MPVTKPDPVLRGAKIIATVHQFSLNKARADKATEDNKLLKDEIVAAMGSFVVASVGTHVVRLTDVPGTQGKANVTITKAMIGQVIVGTKGRAGSTKLEVL